MADPLSISAGVLAIVTAALQSSKSLYDTIQSFRNHERSVRNLREELESLVQVLEGLQGVVDPSNPILSLLERPVSQCSQACREFEDIIIKFSSGGPRTSFRDWAKMKYMEGDIRSFTDMIAGYKSTIAIALGSINMRSTTVTRQVFDEYNQMIQDTVSDLTAHLQDIDEKLGSLNTGNSVSSTDQQRMLEEKESTRQCLRICEDAKSRIRTLQDQYPSIPSTASRRDGLGPFEAQILTHTALSEFEGNMTRIIRHLQGRLDSEAWTQGPERDEERLRLQEEIRTGRQCLEVCNLASDQASRHRFHVLEDISVIDHSHQVIVSTLGDLIHARRVSAGNNSAQWVGSMADASLQQLSRDRRAVGHSDEDHEKPPNLRQNESPVRNQGKSSEPGKTTHFTGNYGAGRKLD